ncbi:hypothetical protein ES703_27648 [subsurface metagenome]
MKYKPLSRKNILILVGLAAIGLTLYLLSFFAILPEVQDFGETLHLTTTRWEVQETSQKYLEDLGLSLEGYRSVTYFTTRGAGVWAETYVLRQVGMKKTNQIFTEELPFWRWRARWYRPLEKEEINVWIDPEGRVCGLWHPIEEDAPGANLSPEVARAIAEKSTKEEGRFDLSEFRLIKTDSEKQKNRRDHIFLYEKEEPEIGEGRFRLKLRVKGDRLFGYHYFFKTPEEFIREERKAGIRKAIIGGLMVLFFIALAITAIVLFFIKFTRRDIRWRLVLILAGILAAWKIIGLLNGLPTFFSHYSTAKDLPVFVTQRIIWNLTGIVSGFLFSCVLLSVVESLWREVFPKIEPLTTWFKKLKPSNWLSREYIDGRLVGYLIFGALGIYSLPIGWITQRYLTSSLRAHSQLPTGILQTFIPSLASWGKAWGAALWGGAALLLFLLLLKKYLKKWKWVILTFVLLSFIGVAIEARSLSEGIIKSSLSLLGLGVAILFIINYFRFNILCYLFSVYFVLLLSNGWYLVTFKHSYFIIHGVIILVLAALPLILLLFAYLRKRLRSTEPRTFK